MFYYLLILSLCTLLTQQLTVQAVAMCIEKAEVDISTIDIQNYSQALNSEAKCEALLEFYNDNNYGEDFDFQGEEWDQYLEIYSKCHIALGEGNQYLTEEEEEICRVYGECYNDDDSNGSVLKMGIVQVVLIAMLLMSLL